MFQSHVNKVINSLSKNNIPSQVLSFVSELLSPSALLEYLDLLFPVTTISATGLRKTKQNRVSCFLNHCRYPQ